MTSSSFCHLPVTSIAIDCPPEKACFLGQMEREDAIDSKGAKQKEMSRMSLSCQSISLTARECNPDGHEVPRAANVCNSHLAAATSELPTSGLPLPFSLFLSRA